MIKIRDIIWLGGLLEGEAWFGLHKEKYPKITLGMTAEDTVNRAADIMKSCIHRHRNMWVTTVSGVCAIMWMMTLYPLLGKARKDRIISIIKHWKNNNFSRAPNGSRSMAICHPNELSAGHGLCNMCYQRYKRKKQLLKKAG